MAAPVMAGTTVIHVETEGSGDVVIDETIGAANVNGALFWNGSAWGVNDTYGHMYFTYLSTGERLETHNVTFFEGTNSLTYANDFYSVVRSTYTYDKPALSGQGIYRVTGALYTITRIDTGQQILLYSRGMGLGVSQSYFDVYIENEIPGTVAFLGDPVWYNFPNITAAAAAALGDVSAYRVGSCPGALSMSGTFAADYYLDIDGGSDMGGMSYEFHTSALDPANAKTQSLLSAFISDFSVEYTDSSGQIQDLYFTPALVSEEYVPAGATCIYTLSSSSDSVSSSGAQGSVGVATSSSTCTWTAASNDSWITLTSGSAGTGAGTVNYTVDANTSEQSRSGSLTVAGQTFTVIQSAAAPACTYALSNTAAAFSSVSTTGSITVTPSADNCTWTAVGNDSWITVTVGSTGTGVGAVFYSVSANTEESTRTGTLTIAGQTFTVIQSGTAPSFDTVQKAYIGYYQRPADPGGLIWWSNYLASHGGSLAAIIEAFANSDESRALYGTIDGSNIAGVITAIYKALFNRDPDTAGRDWYVAGFNAGDFTAATIMLNVLYGAQNDDLVTLYNKLTASQMFTKTIDPELDGSNYRVTYTGDADAVVARQFLSLVTSAKSSIPTQSQITEYIKSYIADPGDAILMQ